MAAPTPSRWRQRVRTAFRYFRIAVLLTALAVVVGIIYLSRSGLPAALQKPLLRELRARGVDLEFRRIRPRFYRGLVAEDVRFGHADTNGVASFRARQADLNLDWLALLRGRVQLDRIAIRQGTLAFNVGEAGGPPRALTLDGIESSVRLLPDDRWVLDQFHAQFSGARFKLAGEITHASAMQDWDMFRRATPDPAPAGSLRARLRGFAERLERIQFAVPPEFRLHVQGDGRDPQSFHARLAVQAPAAETPWGRLTNALLTATLYPATTARLARVSADLESAQTVTPWAEVGGFRMHLDVGSEAGVTNQFTAHLRLTADTAVTRHGQGTNLQFTAHWQQSLTAAIPRTGELELAVEAPTVAAVTARRLRFHAGLAPAPSPPPAGPEWGWWTNLAPYALDWRGEVVGLRAEQGAAQHLALSGRWLAPQLVISNLHADLKDGPVDGAAQLDVATRVATFQVTAAFDAQTLRPFLRERSRAWLAKFSWGDQPPHVSGHGAVTLPAWTNRQPDWRNEVLPTLCLAGEVFATNGAYLGVPADWAHTQIRYTNMVWHLPDLVAANGPGRLHLEHLADDRSRDYLFRIRSTLDPRLLRPLLEAPAQRGFDYFTFTQPPVIAGEVWGRWRQHDRLGATARVALTNFTFRGQSMDSLTAELAYTNRVLHVLHPEVFRARTQTLHAAGVQVDFTTQRAWFTNGFSTAEPQVVARCIGPKTGEGFEPYVFHQPPTVRVEGFAPLRTPGVADLRFEVTGGPFSWWRFNVPQIAGQAHWRGDTLGLSNLRLAFYEGEATGQADFSFASPQPGTDFSFFLTVKDANIARLIPDVFTHTNHLEGGLSGVVSITNANSADPHSWDGWADFQLRDGLIWEMPILGLFSDVINTVTPGWGKSRLSQASGRLGVTNSVMHFDRVEMRSPLLRLQFRGQVDFTGNLDAIAEAEPLRDAWLVGPLVRLTLKPMTKFLEYKVTGTLGQPKKAPLYLPARMLFMPFRPFQTLDEIFGGSSTNSPAKPTGR